MSSISSPLQPHVTEPSAPFPAFDIVMHALAQPEHGIMVGPALSAQTAIVVAALGVLALPAICSLLRRPA